MRTTLLTAGCALLGMIVAWANVPDERPSDARPPVIRTEPEPVAKPAGSFRPAPEVTRLSSNRAE